MNTKDIFAELKQRRVYRAVAVYVVAVFGLWQAADIAIPALSLPQTLMRYIVSGALLGFPFVVILSWIYDLRIAHTEPRSVRAPIRIAPNAVLAILGTVVVLLASGLALRTLAPRVAEDPAGANPQVALEVGVERYFAGNRAEAAAILEAVAANATLPTHRRQEALRYLVRSYSELEDTAQARIAMRSLVSLEPPLALMLPAVETELVVELYYEARREKLARESAVRNPSVVSVVEVLGLVVLGDTLSGVSPEQWRELGSGVTQVLTTELHEQLGGSVAVVERAFQKRSYDVYRYLESPEAGRIRRPTHLLIGSVALRREQILLSAWLIDAELGTLAHSHQVLGEFEDLHDLLTALSKELARRMVPA